MRKRMFSLVFDYIEKTRSKIIMPQIIYEELTGVYEREVRDRLQKFKKSKEVLEEALIEVSVTDHDIDVEGEVNKYLGFVKRRLSISDEDIVPYKDEYLKQVVERAVHRIKPCTEKGEEFRDAILWLTTMDIAETLHQKMLIFISNNVKQFAGSDGKLHPDLAKEAEARGLTINYYNSLNQFIKDHATKIDYITKDWLVSAIDPDKVNERVIEYLTEFAEDRLLKWADEKGKMPTGYVNPVIAFMDLDEFFVYEMRDGSLYVQAIYWGEVEVEFEFEEEVEEDSWDYEYGYDRTQKISTVTKCLYPEIVVYAGVIIKDKEVKHFDIDDWDFG
jgi:hypothetical protein